MGLKIDFEFSKILFRIYKFINIKLNENSTALVVQLVREISKQLEVVGSYPRCTFLSEDKNF